MNNPVTLGLAVTDHTHGSKGSLRGYIAYLQPRIGDNSQSPHPG
jgi:hypothetical protein